MLIDDLHIMLDTFKFVDDVTIYKVVTDPSISQKQVAASQIIKWSNQNLLNINTKRTKEMLFGSIQLHPPSLIVINDGTVECVTSFKLLRLNIANNLSLEEHITSVCNKANKRLHHLKLLKRCLESVDDLLQYYKSVIRPTIENTCPVWQSGLTIIRNETGLNSYSGAQLNWFQTRTTMNYTVLFMTLSRLQLDFDNLGQQFFHKICDSNDCINYILPNKRPIEL